MTTKSPSQIAETLVLVQEVLHEDYLQVHTKSIRYAEDFEGGGGLVSSEVCVGSTSLPVEHTGVGLIDAYFGGLVSNLSDNYPSLRSIELIRFSVESASEHTTNSHNQGADAEADVQVVLSNSYGDHFAFTARSASITKASIEAVNQALSFFINSELATLQVSRALEHYRSSGRPELVAKYTMKLAELVKNTSYSEVLETVQR